MRHKIVFLDGSVDSTVGYKGSVEKWRKQVGKGKKRKYVPQYDFDGRVIFSDCNRIITWYVAKKSDLKKLNKAIGLLHEAYDLMAKELEKTDVQNNRRKRP